MNRTGTLLAVKDAVKDIMHENLYLGGHKASFICGTSDHNIHEHSDLEEDLGLDSLNMSELAIKIEDEFEIEAADDCVVLWKSVGDIVTFVLNETARQCSSSSVG